MPRLEMEINPAEHITTDAIGQPGQRVFYLQGWKEGDPHPTTVILEKIQLQTLASGLEQMLTTISEQKPELPPVEAHYEDEKMRIIPPVDPLFRVGEIGLGYDSDTGLLLLLAREVVMEGSDPLEAAVVRFWISRQQARNLAAWGMEVVQSGRPICPQCGQPMEPEGHFCPKKNGNRH